MLSVAKLMAMLKAPRPTITDERSKPRKEIITKNPMMQIKYLMHSLFLFNV